MGRIIVMARALAAALALAMSTGMASADSCDQVVPGARMGPSPDFNSWPWPNACYISWPGTDSRDYSRNPRLEYERKCRDVPGFLHFEGDYGSNKNTCIFEAPAAETAAPPPSDIPASPRPSVRDRERDANPLARPDPRNAAMAASARAQMQAAVEAARADRWDEAEAKFDRMQRTAAEMYLREVNRAANQDIIDAQKAPYEISTCMWSLSNDMAALSHGRGPTGTLDTACENQAGNEIVRETREKLRIASAAHAAEVRRAATPAPPAGKPTLAVDARCLVVGTPRNTGVGCAKGKAWIMTHVGIAKNAQCPDSVRFLYVDENGDERAEAPTNLQTCGTPPRDVRVSR